MLLNIEFLIATFFKTFKAVPVTLNITIVALLLSIAPAFIIAFTRIKGIKAVGLPGTAYVSFIRGTPIVLQILVVYSLFPSILNVLFKKMHSSVNIFDLNPIIYAYIVFALNTTATMSEVFRSALQTVSKGQYEAALCAGLSPVQAYRRIIIPQALFSALPNLCNLTIGLIKNTSLAFMMTVKDVTAIAKIEASYGYNYIEAYLDIFVVYIIICCVVQFLFRLMEKKFTFTGVRRNSTFLNTLKPYKRRITNASN